MRLVTQCSRTYVPGMGPPGKLSVPGCRSCSRPGPGPTPALLLFLFVFPCQGWRVLGSVPINVSELTIQLTLRPLNHFRVLCVRMAATPGSAFQPGTWGVSFALLPQHWCILFGEKLHRKKKWLPLIIFNLTYIQFIIGLRVT